MSIYVISDLHGCKKEFDEMLTLIDFSSYDEMYIIGDICDRGKESIALLQEIMANSNMHMICGNHDEWLIKYMPVLIDIKKGNPPMYVDEEMRVWLLKNGGYSTADQFMDLSFPECHDILLYLENIPYYVNLEIAGKKYLLVHSGLGPDAHSYTRVSSIPKSDLIWPHIELDDNPYEDTTLIVGHTPTFLYGPEYDGKIAHGKKKSILHIDCGCIFGRALGCVRLNDGKEFYVPSTYPYFVKS